jgi:hypothetical protein
MSGAVPSCETLGEGEGVKEGRVGVKSRPACSEGAAWPGGAWVSALEAGKVSVPEGFVAGRSGEMPVQAASRTIDIQTTEFFQVEDIKQPRSSIYWRMPHNRSVPS